jgi:HSP20 family protein
MAIGGWDPFRDLVSIQNELNRLFGRTYAGTESGPAGGSWVPPMDIYETNEAAFDQGVLTIQVPKAEEDRPKKITIKAVG